MGGRLTVRYFAAAAAAAGTEVEELEVEGPVDRDALFARLAERHPTAPEGEPPLELVLRRSSCLVSGRRLAQGRTVSPGDTVDVLPPFSGG
ncbi:MAG: MoaD/ThiS family protein [Nesterenkonia sp.]|uniref:MoaD/ThiS family protein n=1 Tax=Nesterenkonia marinintestina TaxID=2979865 RepID=UPI0021BED613|nr:MoaD/ThiS family protein [Nesterenkonia sp. GX14115]MDO5492224.1 MoaD/ThiS family protein [Nesterenkonia sp.]